MAKRSRRVSKKSRPPVAVAPTPAVEAQQPAPAVQSNGRVKQVVVDFAQEYLYVYHDMRTVALIAVAMFVILFALGFAF
ncbi:MAG: hypothetical protein D6784_10660 [Chloroflexi bacterium]|nr:MAG: hypothetical protein D6784_10660 [Chloroflexota bacterium]